MSAQVGVITFPGSNGDHDAFHAFSVDLGVPTRMVDYRETSLDGLAAVAIPGGFSYGDHLRCGAIARFAPIVAALREFAERGGPVIGFCNGFQILTEAHLLPGALLRNRTLRFHCHQQHIVCQNTRTPWTSRLREGQVITLPVAHGEGAFFADDATLDRIEANGQVVFRYVDAQSSVSPEGNFNGSSRSIAGICNERGNVVGLMPHPERATDRLISSGDGYLMLSSIFDALGVPA